jgi:transposase
MMPTRTMLGHAKTDKLDAEVIVRFAPSVNPQPQPMIAAAAQQWRDLTHRRQPLVEIQVAEKPRLTRASTTIPADIEDPITTLVDWVSARSCHINNNDTTKIGNGSRWFTKTDLHLLHRNRSGQLS